MAAARITKRIHGSTELRAVVSSSTSARGREGPKHFLQQFDGLLQTDGYAAYDHIGVRKMVHAVSWSHARRKFIDAVKLNPKDVAAIRTVARMGELFAVDAEARAEKMNYAARHALRQQKTPGLLADIRALVLAAQKNSLPKSATGKAANYTLTLWSKLTQFSNIRHWSYPTTSPRTPCAPSQSAEKLDPHRQRPRRTEDRSDTIGG